MTSSFDPRALEARYARLDNLPESLVAAVVTHPTGDLDGRLEGVLAWRNALLAGRLPAVREVSWPPEPGATSLATSLDRLGIARFLRDQPEVVDALLADVLGAVASGASVRDTTFASHLAELEARERAARVQSKGRGSKKPIDPAVRKRIEAEAARKADERLGAELDAALTRKWAERVRLWSEIAEVFGDLGDLLGIGRDLSSGVLQRQGWRDILALAELVKRLPQLREVVRTLGRMQSRTSTAEPVLETIFAPLRRAAAELQEVRSPLVPEETRGVDRSGEIARMLPSEAALLGHPTLRLLWHARRAERALLTYRVEGVSTERVQGETERPDAKQVPRPPVERGPIVVCLDTSGSMHGSPELVAKAVVLEALRVAHSERRACYLYAFSAPSQVEERSLTLTRVGLGELMVFLSMSFHGGTDVVAPITRALARLATESWKHADLLLVSDGEFPAPAELVQRVAAARKDGSRFHGLLVGADSSGMASLCDPVHKFREWASLVNDG